MVWTFQVGILNMPVIRLFTVGLDAYRRDVDEHGRPRILGRSIIRFRIVNAKIALSMSCHIKL